MAREHLPKPFMPKSEWDRLYEFNAGADECDCSEGEWKTIAIPDGATALEVYRMIPSAPNFEYGGYLAEDKIHFTKCNEKSAGTRTSALCNFHTHPTDLPGTVPDMPSAKDVYAFLKWSNHRAVTVGKELIWVFDKTEQTIPVIQKFANWERQNMLATFRQVEQQGSNDAAGDYVFHPLGELGLHWPQQGSEVTEKLLKSWAIELEQCLRFKVTVFDR